MLLSFNKNDIITYRIEVGVKMSTKKKKGFLILLISLCCCFIISGYFVLINALVINGHVKVEDAVWDVRFKEIKTLNIIGEASNYQTPQLTNHVINFFAKFKNAEDAIVYKIKIVNSGNLDAELNNINFFSNDKPYLDLKMTGLDVKDVLRSGEEREIEVKLTYTGAKNGKVEDIEGIKLVLNWKQYNK